MASGFAGHRRGLVAHLLFAFFILSPVGMAAQEVSVPPAGAGSVVGTVVDAETGEPVPSTLVSARAANDTTSVLGTISDPDGRFQLTGLDAGDYQLIFNRLGYASHVEEVTIEATADAPIVLGAVSIGASAVVLDGVDVVTQRPAVVHAVDRDIYSVDAMPGAAGATAAEVMADVPDLNVDADGRVTMRGESPAVYINGRPAPMRGESLEIFLQQFPADNIESIETMPDPSARYDAEGSGGIVNIVLKRDARLGVNGNVFMNGETRGNLGSGGRVTYQDGPLTLVGGANLRFAQLETSSTDLRQNLLADPVNYLEQEALSDRSNWSGNVDLTAEYAFGSSTTLSGRGRLFSNASETDRLTTYTEMDSDWEISDRYDRLSVNERGGRSGNLALELEHVIVPRSHELAVEFEFDHGMDDRDSFNRRRISNLDPDLDPDPDDEFAFQLTEEDRKEQETEVGLRVDYTRPWGDAGQFEVGARSTIGTDQDGRVRRTGIEGADELAAEDIGFRHQQRISAAYLTVRRRVGDLNAQVGLRAEHTDISFEIPDTASTFGNSYVSLFPNANLSYTLGDGRRLRLSYSVRVRRPGANVLNPSDSSTDPLDRRIGNPNIDPQYTHSYSFDASWSGRLGTLRLAPFYRRSVDEWSQYTTVDADGVATRTYDNLGETTSYGSSVSFSLRDLGPFRGSINANGQRSDRDWDDIVGRDTRSTTRWQVRTNLSARVSDALTLNGSARYNSPRDLAQGRTSATTMTTLGVRQRLLDNRLSLNLSVNDPFDLYENSTNSRSTSYVELNSTRESARRATLSLSYSFGSGSGGGRGGWRR